MKQWRYGVGVVSALVLALAPAVYANESDSVSSSFRVTESQVGGTGDFNSGSTNFKFLPSTDDGGSTLGEAAAGSSASTNFQSGAGFNTTAQPSLTMIVNSGSINLNTLSASIKTTATATFSVRNYTSYGYAVTVVGAPPTHAGNPLDPLTTDTASVAGTEQFGINLVLNNTSAVGADPVQVPSSSFSYGVAGDGSTGTYGTTRPYTVPEKWRFNSGDVVASAPKSSGQTDYTVTFMANKSTLTPGGTYSGEISFVATGTY